MNTYEHPPKKTTSIKTWAEDDRPREKLILKGKHSLSNSELLAILIGSGNKQDSALDIAKNILESCNQNLAELSRGGITKLTSFHGIGEAKALTIEAALELGRRRQQSEALLKPIIRSSQDSYQVLKPNMEDLTHEEFWILYLDRKNMIIALENISKGGVSGTVVDARIIFKKAIELLASNLILAHNHPSGNTSPSASDQELTRKLIQAGKFLDITILDHLIITSTNYYSFADEGKMT